MIKTNEKTVTITSKHLRRNPHGKRRTVIGRPKIVILYNKSLFFHFSKYSGKSGFWSVFNKKPPQIAGVFIKKG
jgi:hypothetical protein